ncbi:MAG: hypothetical protein CMJ59_22655, partial [Planctomycetaceae bacterium]|nr:hypothetical protein [Planctomycetaceae bacterium]
MQDILRSGLSDGTLKLMAMSAEFGFEFVAWISQEEARKREQPDRVAQRPINVQHRRRRRSRSDSADDTNGTNGETNGHKRKSNGRRRRSGEARETNGEARETNGEARE